MFLILLLITFLVSLTASYVVVRIFEKPIEGILERIIADRISTAWLKYMKFAIYVVGISGGVRIYQLEKYITPRHKEAAPILLNADRWTLEIYRTLISTLQSIAWMFLIFFVFALIAYVIMRVFEIRRSDANKP